MKSPNANLEQNVIPNPVSVKTKLVNVSLIVQIWSVLFCIFNVQVKLSPLYHLLNLKIKGKEVVENYPRKWSWGPKNQTLGEFLLKWGKYYFVLCSFVQRTCPKGFNIGTFVPNVIEYCDLRHYRPTYNSYIKFVMPLNTFPGDQDRSRFMALNNSE